jgi:polyisoprenoid-binding protein YceI
MPRGAASRTARYGRSRGSALLLGLILATGIAPLAHAQRHAIDGAASKAGFTVRLIAVLPLDGEFGAIRGWIDVDRTAGTGRVHAVLAADSLSMRDPDHAAWARSAEFFDAARHPEIRFDSEPVALATLATGGRLRGRLSVRGIERPVALVLEPGTCTPDDMLACEVGVRGRIRRSDFGMDARRATVSDWVALDIAIRTAADISPAPGDDAAGGRDAEPWPDPPR